MCRRCYKLHVNTINAQLLHQNNKQQTHNKQHQPLSSAPHLSEYVVCVSKVEVVCAASTPAATSPWHSTFEPLLAIGIIHLTLLWIRQHLERQQQQRVVWRADDKAHSERERRGCRLHVSFMRAKLGVAAKQLRVMSQATQEGTV